MIYSLRGKIVTVGASFFVIECGGVGYKCTAPLSTLASLPSKGNEAFVYTHMAVKEDSVDLFGFMTEAEVDCFRVITSVSGVGPKIGIALLSEFMPDRLMLLIASGDHKTLTRASGVGAKLAQRIVLELKDKTGSVISNVDTISAGNAVAATNTAEAVGALVTLGFSQSDSALAVGKLDPSLPVEALIKEALNLLSGVVR